MPPPGAECLFWDQVDRATQGQAARTGEERDSSLIRRARLRASTAQLAAASEQNRGLAQHHGHATVQATGRPATQGELDPPPWFHDGIDASHGTPIPPGSFELDCEALVAAAGVQVRTPPRPACAPPSLNPGSAFGAPREIWNIGEASPALVQNHDTPPENGS
ncbi:uncharacterized protein TrAtP1_009467 [Trichoderma atroviride]|uniref:uncharacterized protein n=1 Tax=Hypocrea atroviridis TaxID=63577 RepID=UPI0033280646|nr:hypothetical protein TrAtP1_009467 [Trichoderma atroviride]